MEHKDKKIEEFIDKVFKEETLEKPSIDFTKQVMDQVNLLAEQKSIVYKPLISKQAWLAIAFITLILSVYLIMNEAAFTWDLFKSMAVPELPKFSFDFLTFNVSKASMYAFIFFAIMLAIQIPILKKYVNKQLA